MRPSWFSLGFPANLGDEAIRSVLRLPSGDLLVGGNFTILGGSWANTTFRATAVGMTANALAVAVYGFQQLSLPMPVVHPQGPAGCTLAVDDDILIDFQRGNGSVQTSIVIPNSPGLIGATFFHQVVPVELDAQHNIVALTATNSLALTIGAW